MVKKIDVIAFGNSLTVGFIPSRLANQPYSQFLMEMVNDVLKQLKMNDTVEVRFINKGVNGDLTSSMLQRFRQDVINLSPNYVIVLGGANDVGWNFPVKQIKLEFSDWLEILDHIEQFFVVCKKHKATVQL